MMRLVRMLIMALVAVLLSLVLLLLITGRNLGDLSQVEIQARWFVLVVKGAPVARFVKEHFGDTPPLWVRHLALVWHQARPLSWWWLPLVMLGAMVFVGRRSRRHRPPGTSPRGKTH